MSFNWKVTLASLYKAFLVATSRALFDMSIAVTWVFNSLLKAMAIQPLPVPTSIILGVIFLNLMSFRVSSTKPSVSKRGISTLSSTNI